ncbi:MAG: hypothetical protein HS126_33455 [Anaerolineales bacterium]|nr:hypothetical protein [Anaerolineales bacterium]
MTDYSIALFLHIVGALGFFVALGLEWISLRGLERAATSEQAREWLGVLGLLRRIGPASMAMILLAGFYMMATVWGGVAWIGIALGAMILLAVLAVALSGRRMAAVGRAAAAESGALSPAFRQRLHDPLLWTSLQTRIAIALGIVFLMTVKPELAGSLLTIGLAIILGLVSAWPRWGRSRVKEPAVEGRGA